MKKGERGKVRRRYGGMRVGKGRRVGEGIYQEVATHIRVRGRTTHHQEGLQKKKEAFAGTGSWGGKDANSLN